MSASPPMFSVLIDGKPIAAELGQTLAAVMLGAGLRAMRSDKAGNPRGMFCNMGTCFECTVTLGDGSRVRACLTDVAPGMSVRTGKD
jgi:predicted molibdopterin-dependent oxidoreductase YjgC